MPYSQTIPLVEGDTLPILYFTLKDSNRAADGMTLDPDDSSTWRPIDLTATTVALKIREVGSTVVKESLNCAIEDAALGEVSATFTATTFDAAGMFEGEIEVTASGGGIQTVHDLVRFKVRSQF